MSKEKKDRLVNFSCIGLSIVALVLFVLCCFDKDNRSTMVALGLACVSLSTLFNAIRTQQNKSAEEK